MKVWSRWRDEDDIERALRETRPVPPTDLVRAISREVQEARTPAPIRGGYRRLALVAVLTAMLLAGFGSFGAFSYAKGGGGSSGAANPSPGGGGSEERGRGGDVRKNEIKSSHNQYGVQICHRTGSKTHPYVLITVNQSAVAAHQSHPPQNGHSDIIPAPPGGCPGN
jgi:hypothetical protein